MGLSPLLFDHPSHPWTNAYSGVADFSVRSRLALRTYGWHLAPAPFCAEATRDGAFAQHGGPPAIGSNGSARSMQ